MHITYIYIYNNKFQGWTEGQSRREERRQREERVREDREGGNRRGREGKREEMREKRYKTNLECPFAYEGLSKVAFSASPHAFSKSPSWQ